MEVSWPALLPASSVASLFSFRRSSQLRRVRDHDDFEITVTKNVSLIITYYRRKQILFSFLSFSLFWIVCHCCFVRIRHVRLFILFYSSFFFENLSPIQRTHLISGLFFFFSPIQADTHARTYAHTHTPASVSRTSKSSRFSSVNVNISLLFVLFENPVRCRDTPPSIHLSIFSTAVIDRFLVASIQTSTHTHTYMHIEIFQYN